VAIRAAAAQARNKNLVLNRLSFDQSKPPFPLRAGANGSGLLLCFSNAAPPCRKASNGRWGSNSRAIQDIAGFLGGFSAGKVFPAD